MAESSNARSEIQGIVIERVFDAPRDLVWRAWTEADRFARWYGPEGFSVPVCQIDAQVGGRVFLSMRGPNGFEMWYVGTFKEVDAPRRFVRTEAMADKEGNIVAASHYGMPEDFPRETLVTVVLEEDGPARTRMTMRHEGLPGGPMAAGAEIGWNQAFDKLGAYTAAS